MKSLPKKRMTADDRRLSLIEATITVVARSNYDRATTAKIAKTAGVNEALIYSHFSSKKELQLATLDYLVNFRLSIYASNPVFLPENADKSVVQALNRQYQERLASPDIDMFNCILKAQYAIDADIREKGFDCSLLLHHFIKSNLLEDSRRGFFDATRYNPDIIAWEILGRIMLFSTLAINGKLDLYGRDNIETAARYFETIYLNLEPGKESRP